MKSNKRPGTRPMLQFRKRVDSLDGGYPEGLVKAEGQHRLCRYPDGAALCQDLGECASACPGPGSYSRAFPASGDGADDSAKRRAAAGVLGGALVRSDPRLSLLTDIYCV